MTGGTDSVILKYLLLSSPDLLSVGQGDTKLSNKGKMLDRSTKLRNLLQHSMMKANGIGREFSASDPCKRTLTVLKIHLIIIFDNIIIYRPLVNLSKQYLLTSSN